MAANSGRGAIFAGIESCQATPIIREIDIDTKTRIDPASPGAHHAFPVPQRHLLSAQ